MKDNTHVYFSVDIETDGESPATASMLSIGVVAMDPKSFDSGNEFYRTLKRLPNRQPDNDTMEWWDQFPEQWAATRKGASDPKDVMESLDKWVRAQLQLYKDFHKLQHDPIAIFVADPAGFDFSFVFFYLHYFLGRSVFGFSALDLQSYVMALLNNNFRQAGSSSNHLSDWKTPLPRTHHALEDARAQADFFRRLRKWRDKRRFVEE